MVKNFGRVLNSSSSTALWWAAAKMTMPPAVSPRAWGGGSCLPRSAGAGISVLAGAYDDEAVRTEVTSESLMLEVPTIRLGWLPLKSTPVTTPVVCVEAAT